MPPRKDTRAGSMRCRVYARFKAGIYSGMGNTVRVYAVPDGQRLRRCTTTACRDQGNRVLSQRLRRCTTTACRVQGNRVLSQRLCRCTTTACRVQGNRVLSQRLCRCTTTACRVQGNRVLSQRLCRCTTTASRDQGNRVLASIRREISRRSCQGLSSILMPKLSKA